MELHATHCPLCSKVVHITRTALPHRSGQASLPDGGKLVWMEVGEACEGEACPLSGTSTLVMGVRLARSLLDKSEPWPLVHAGCTACGGASDMTVLDHSHALCRLCGSTNTLELLKLDDGTYLPTREGGP